MIAVQYKAGAATLYHTLMIATAVDKNKYIPHVILLKNVSAKK